AGVQGLCEPSGAAAGAAAGDRQGQGARAGSLDPGSTLVAASLAQRDPDQIGGVLGAELLHDARAVHLDGARADAEVPAGPLVGGAGHDLRQHILLARGERLAARKMKDLAVGATLGRLAAGL